jgi:histone H3/H4
MVPESNNASMRLWEYSFRVKSTAPTTSTFNVGCFLDNLGGRYMDNGAHKLLESATQRTLHAHAFSRSSTQASLALTDLLSRYLALLASTSAKYAQHAGRTKLSVRDIVGALDELGVGLDELSDYASSEAKELNRYALYSARRVEDLMEFKCMSSCIALSLQLISHSTTVGRITTGS